MDFSLTLLLLPVEIVWISGMSVWLVLEKRSPVATLAWIFALSWLPILGIVVYLLIGPRRLNRKRLRHSMARRLVDEAAPSQPEQEEANLSFRVRQLEALGRGAGEGPAWRARAVNLYDDGSDAYAALEEGIRGARHHVHLAYYIYAPDRAGLWLRELLIERAKAGVEVRLLVDALGSKALSRAFLRPLREAGVEVAFFNQISLARFRPRLLNFRTHRKIVVVDGDLGFTGGMNITDDQSATFAGEAAWRDTHLRIEGAATRWLQKVFLEDWYFSSGSAPKGEAYLPTTQPEGPKLVQILSSGPDEDRHPVEKAFFAAIAGARRRVWVTTPYFVPGVAMLTALGTAALRGVDVRVLVPHRSDSRLVDAAARSQFDELIFDGVSVYTYQPTMLHAKTMIVDDEVGYVGTANMDNRSFRLNFEVVAAVYDEETVDALASHFERDLERSEALTVEALAKDGFAARVGQGAARLFTPLL